LCPIIRDSMASLQRLVSQCAKLRNSSLGRPFPFGPVSFRRGGGGHGHHHHGEQKEHEWTKWNKEYGVEINPPAPIYRYLAVGLGATMWLWIFWRFKHDYKVMFGLEHPWDHDDGDDELDDDHEGTHH